MTNILFVCTGNTCRSPIADALLKSKALETIEVKSAGVFASNGSDASEYTKQVLVEKGVPCDHQSTSLTEELVDWASYIFTMTESHKQLILERFDFAKIKTFTLKEFVQQDATDKNIDIIDPFGGSVHLYRKTLEEIEPLIEELVRKIEN